MSSEHVARSKPSRVALACWIVAMGVAAAAVTRLDAQLVEKPRAGDLRRFYPDDPLWVDPDMRDIPPVAPFDLSQTYEFLNETFGDTVRSRGRALNVNTVDEVPDSSWFTNRLGRSDMSVEDVVKGPDTVAGPAPGTWHVTGRPDAGITPKFTIRDARGDTYLIKLDPAIAPELPSSVEVICTKIFHAIGYHVPEDFIVTFDVGRLAVAPGATIKTSSGRKPIQMADVERWLENTPRTPNGDIRALASRYVPGEVVGQFRYTGTRPDDPNDIYPHERRRELRGLHVFAAWLNHDDARSVNSIDTYVEENGRRYIRHYLQDFGSTLGSGSIFAHEPRAGNEYIIERGSILKGLVTFGLWERRWMHVKYPHDPSIGNIEADYFEPRKWKTEYPQPAFNQMDAADAFWAARIASRFTDRMIRAVVETGRLTNPEAARYLSDVIIKRRDKAVAYWLTRTNPLDEFEVRSEGNRAEVTFDNAAMRLRVAQPGARYKVRWSGLDNLTGRQQAVGNESESTETVAAISEAAWGPVDDSGSRYAVASIQTIHPAFPHWVSPVTVTVRNQNGSLKVVGIERPTEMQD